MHDLSLATEFLHTVHPFNALRKDDLRLIARKLEAAYYPQGKVIFASSPPPGLAIIRKGAVRLVDVDQKFLDKRSETEVFGHGIYFHGELKQYTAQAEEDCLLWHLPQAEFDSFCLQFPALQEYFSSQLKSRLSSAAEVSHSVTRLRELLRRAPIMVDGASSIRTAAELMSRDNVSSVLVMRGDQLGGIVTDKDLRARVLAAGVDPAVAIDQVMTENPVSLPPDASIDEALLLMIRDNYRHLPIVEDGRPLGLLTAGDLLRTQSEHPLRLVRDIYKKNSVAELAALSGRLPSLFERMVTIGRDVEQIGRMVTHITDAFTVKLIMLAEKELGAPPMPYAWVVFGSQAREEQTAKTDQDNGLILKHKANSKEEQYFARLSEFVCQGLDQLGYVYCPGEIMALNVKWRVPLSRWKHHFDTWIDQPDPKSVMHSSIFFDMRCVHGDALLVEKLLVYATARAKDNRIFRRFMAGNILTHRPPIGFFRRFVQEHDGTQSEGLNLKHRGIVPITDLVRMRALEGGITQANTFRRIELAAAMGVMNEDDASSLRDALRLIAKIRLVHQADRMRRGKKPTNHVPPDELSPLMRRNLKAAFMLVVEAQNALGVRYQVH